MTKNVLYLSKSDPTCYYLLLDFVRLNILKYIKIIIVEENLDKVPDKINSVPALELFGINKILYSNDIKEYVKIYGNEYVV